MANKPALSLQRFEAVLAKIAQGVSIRKALKQCNTGSAAFYPAIQNNPEMARQYAQARMAGLDAIADEAVSIADDSSLDPQDRRVKIDTRKWLLAVYNPAKYSPRAIVSGDPNAPIRHSVDVVSKLFPEFASGDEVGTLESVDSERDRNARPRLELLGKTGTDSSS